MPNFLNRPNIAAVANGFALTAVHKKDQNLCFKIINTLQQTMEGRNVKLKILSTTNPLLVSLTGKFNQPGYVNNRPTGGIERGIAQH